MLIYIHHGPLLNSGVTELLNILSIEKENDYHKTTLFK